MSGVVTLERHGRIVTAAPARLVSHDDHEVAWAEGLIRHNPLYAWVLGRFVSAGEANANGHIFDADELRTATATLVHAPLNMLHRPQQILGTYVGAELVYPAAAAAQGDSPPFVESLAAMWRYYFQEEYAILKMAHDAGLLAQSMECIPKTVTCAAAECGLTFPYAGRTSDTYCGHINGPPSGPRHLNQPHFSAGAVVIPPAVPAWRGAKVTRLAATLRTAEAEGLAAGLYDQVAAAIPGLSEAQREQFMAAVMALTGPADEAERRRSQPAAADVGPHSYQAPPGEPMGDKPCAECGRPPDSPVHHGITPPSTAGDEVPETAAMVALYPSADVAATMAVSLPGALSPADLHVTLAYLGPEATVLLDRSIIEVALRTLASATPPMDGWVAGIGRFSAGYPAGQDAWPLYASIDLPALPEFRQDVVDALATVGVDIARNHGFTPHMTLAYVDKPDEEAAGALLAAGVPPIALRFESVVLAWGPERTVFAFGDEAAADKGVTVGDIVERGRREAAAIPVWDPLIGRSFSADKRDALARKGHAMGDGSFPIVNKADLANAIKAYGRAKDPAAAKRHIIKRAKALGAVDLLPEGWS